MPKAYSYLHFSTPAHRAGHATAVQSAAAEQFCKRRHLELDAHLHMRTATGAAARGTSPPERALADFLERVRSGEVSRGCVLVVENMDGATREAAVPVAKLFEKIVLLGVNVVTLIDGRECTRAVLKADPTALLYAVVGFIRSHDETALKSRRVRASWTRRRERAQKKIPISAICPAWLMLDREANAFRVIRERVRVVQRIFRDALRGVGQAEIAESLNREGTGVFGRGKLWHRSYILKLLRSQAVLGTYSPHTLNVVDGRRRRTPAGTAIRNYYPRIIEPDLFAQVQTLIGQSRSPLRGRHAKVGKVVNVFGGLAHCGRCGASVTLVAKGKPPKIVRYLVCSAARVNAGCRRYQAIRYERFEAALLRDRAWLFATMPARERRADLDRLITEAESTAYGIGDTLEKLRSPVARRSVAATVRVRELESEQEKLRLLAESLRAERETTSATYVRDRVEELRNALADAPLDRTLVNALMRQVFSSVTVDYAGDDLAFQWRHGGQSEVELGS